MPDAPSAASFLKGKVGGVPIWAIGGAVAVGAVGFIWYQNRKKPAAAAGDPNALGTAAGTAAAAPPIYVSTLPQTPDSGTSTPTTPVAGWNTRGDTSFSGAPGTQIPVMAGTSDTSGQVGTLPENSPVTLASPTPVGGTWGTQGSRQFYKVSLPSGVSGYVLAQDLVASGRGGFDSVSGMGGLHDTPWARMTQKYNVPAYWASGMGGAGAAGTGPASHHVSHLAKKLGVPAHRLVSLNPQLRGQRFMTRPGQAILAG